MTDDKNLGDQISDEEFKKMKEEEKRGVRREVEGSNFGEFPEAPAEAPASEDAPATEQDDVVPDEDVDVIEEDAEDGDDEDDEDDEDEGEDDDDEKDAPEETSTSV